MDFLTIEITPKKVRGNNIDFSVIEITSKKVRGSNVDVLIIKITSKKYMELMRKFVEIWSSTYRFNVVCPLGHTSVFRSDSLAVQAYSTV